MALAVKCGFRQRNRTPAERAPKRHAGMNPFRGVRRPRHDVLAWEGIMTTNMHWVRIALAAVLSSGALACGDDDDSGAGGSTASTPKIDVASSKSLASLDANDVKKVCDALADLTNETLGADGQRFSCTLAGALAGISQGTNGMTTIDKAKCKKAMDDCLAMASSSTDTMSMATCDMVEATNELKDCTASVGDLQACLDATASAFHALVGSLSCDDAKVDGTVMAQPATQNPHECQTLQMKCPNLKIGGDSSSIDSNMTPSPTGCDDTCEDANDDFCDDGGPGSDDNFCGLGTDCTDCGKR
jgi:hypothetical protein